MVFCSSCVCTAGKDQTCNEPCKHVALLLSQTSESLVLTITRLLGEKKFLSSRILFPLYFLLFFQNFRGRGGQKQKASKKLAVPESQLLVIGLVTLVNN